MEIKKIILFELNILWSEIYTTNNPDLENDLLKSDEVIGDGLDMVLVHNFDYEALPDNRWEFYSDMTMRLPDVASITIRSQFQILAEDFDWDLFFNEEILNPLIEAALNATTDSFKYFCQENNLILPGDMSKEGYKVGEEMVKRLCKDLVTQYFNHRKFYDIDNEININKIALICPMGTTMNISLNLTFLVMDEILFNNKNFNRKQNRDVFFEYVPEMKYNSLRMKCIQIGKHDVTLTGADEFFFMKCITCAVQMLVGDKSDFLIPVLEERNVTREVQGIFFKSASKLVDLYNSLPEEKGFNEEKFEWNKMIQ
jgi:hypothetical protein